MKTLASIIESLGVIGLPSPQNCRADAARRNDLRTHLLLNVMVLLALLMPMVVMSSTTGVEFKGVYDFIYGAATGYLGRAIAIVGGLVCLGIAAGGGKVVIAAVGMVLAIFGALGPTIINAIFKSAVIF